jgi:hypothetical protein
MNKNKLIYLPSLATENININSNDLIIIKNNNNSNNYSMKSMKFVFEENQIENITDFANSL